MNKSQVITARIDTETMAMVDRVAKAKGRSRSWLAARAIERMAQEEGHFLDFIKKGEDDIERGDCPTHEEVQVWLKGLDAEAAYKLAQQQEQDEAA